MSKKFKLTLFENGIDSLKEGIRYFFNGSHNTRDYKFAILLLFHGVELILKERLAKEHRLLVFANIDNKTVEASLKTVPYDVLIKRLLNAKVGLGEELVKAFGELEDQRNRVQHSVVSLSEEFVKDVIGRTCKHLIEFMRDELDEELEDHLAANDYKHLIEAINFYEEKLKLAKKELAKDTIQHAKDDPYYEIVMCEECGEECVAVSDDDLHEYVECYFCKAKHYVERCPRCDRIELLQSEPDPDDWGPCSDCWDEYMSKD
ncbi:hypothetical protein EH220_06525 [bacterium]|nr:MAG: hypothetical protein EH220_06525 [bacterium]